MQLDDDICYCFHVSLRKLLNYARREKPACDAQMSNCLGAGTGCGWCIPILHKIRLWGIQGAPWELSMSPDEYAAARDSYRRSAAAPHAFAAGAGAGDASDPGEEKPISPPSDDAATP